MRSFSQNCLGYRNKSRTYLPISINAHWHDTTLWICQSSVTRFTVVSSTSDLCSMQRTTLLLTPILLSTIIRSLSLSSWNIDVTACCMWFIYSATKKAATVRWRSWIRGKTCSRANWMKRGYTCVNRFSASKAAVSIHRVKFLRLCESNH